MKKILILVSLFVGLVITASAQRGTLLPLVGSATANVGDTISTSAGLDTVQKIITLTAGYSALGIQVNTTKVSGTVVGKAYLYSSIDGVNYVVTDSSAAFVNQTTNVATFTKTGGIPYVFYRVDVRAADGANSTQVNIVRVWYVARKFNN